MLFNSIDFALFLPIVFLLYWFGTFKNIKYQNALIAIASYVFYGWWDWRFLSLIIFSTIVDFTVGLAIANQNLRLNKRILLWISISVNLGLLGFFKYYNFFVENFVTAFTFLGQPIQTNSLDIILPVGISFYTFQTLSYTIDIYNKKISPTNDFVAFTAFVSFFPQLVAGPIERASNLLPQFYKNRIFNYNNAVDGLRQILWGFFKKVVVADNCAEYANLIFNNSDDYSGSTLVLGAIFFAFQIYGDFSGYSDIAIGTARLFGFNLMKNFAFPYFSRDIAEFWRRWHISLSTWFRDYLYIPLGGSRGGLWMKIRNTFIIFIVSGFWHGANWTFIIWGALNAIYFLPLLLTNNNRNHIEIVAKGRLFPSSKELLNIVITFIITIFAWIFFRASNMKHALSYIANIFDDTIFSTPHYLPYYVFFFIAVLLVVEWLQRDKEFALEKLELKMPKSLRWTSYLVLTLMIAVFFNKGNTFIYFQF